MIPHIYTKSSGIPYYVSCTAFLQTPSAPLTTHLYMPSSISTAVAKLSCLQMLSEVPGIPVSAEPSSPKHDTAN